MYNPSEVGKKGSLFGLPCTDKNADLIIVPVELDVTASYSDGTSKAPKKILDESSQLDLSVPGLESPWEIKVALADSLQSTKKNTLFRAKAKQVIDALEREREVSPKLLVEINDHCASVHLEVEQVCSDLLENGKFVGILGGDHSSPLGLVHALAARQDFGILQVDAHMDLRDAYEGFDYSHASIMHNALKCAGVKSITQVGVRDYCEEEEIFISNFKKPVYTFFDEVMFGERLLGANWKLQVDEIVDTLPENVYVSFDIDGLDPSLCPNTGTPVPGGLGFNEIMFLLNEVVASGRKLIGFDLCEVGGSQWDANVGARVLYRLCLNLGRSHKLI